MSEIKTHFESNVNNQYYSPTNPTQSVCEEQRQPMKQSVGHLKKKLRFSSDSFVLEAKSYFKIW